MNTELDDVLQLLIQAMIEVVGIDKAEAIVKKYEQLYEREHEN